VKSNWRLPLISSIPPYTYVISLRTKTFPEHFVAKYMRDIFFMQSLTTNIYKHVMALPRFAEEKYGLELWSEAAQCFINCCGQPIRGGPPAWELVVGLTIFHCKFSPLQI
jgi:hypothetical protein